MRDMRGKGKEIIEMIPNNNTKDNSSSPIIGQTNSIHYQHLIHSTSHHLPQQPPKRDLDPTSNPPTLNIRYKECVKNHAASIGGHVIDGCGEFMPSGEQNTPQHFICAACECHRSFHRKEIHHIRVLTPSSEDINMFDYNNDHGVQLSTKKRSRTKFTQQQKDRMMEFAEKIGWKLHKQDEEEVEKFCCQLGFKTQVFKVWMHNTKQAMKKIKTGS